MKAFYPAVFTPSEDGGYYVDFPDVPCCYTDGKDIAEATEFADDVLNLTIYGIERDNEEMPQPSDPASLTVPNGGFISMFQADTVAYAKKINKKSVSKTVTIPGWLDYLAQKSSINFSQTLQEGLAQKLNVSLA